MIYKKIYGESKLYAAFLKILGFERGIGKFIDKCDLACSNAGKILDAGCGSGIVGLRLLKRFPDSTLLATDIEKNFLNETVLNSQKLNVGANRVSVGLSDINTPRAIKLSDGSEVILEKQSFDIVSTGAVLGYAKNREEAMKELLSLIKPGGYFMDIDMNDGIIAKVVASNYHYRAMPLEEMKMIIEGEGLEVSIIEFSASHFPANLTRIGIIGRKNRRSVYAK